MKKTIKKSAARPAMKSKPAAKPMMRKGGLTKYQKPTNDKSNEYASDLEESYATTYGPNWRNWVRSEIKYDNPVNEQALRSGNAGSNSSPTPFQKLLAKYPNASSADTNQVQRIAEAQELLRNFNVSKHKKGGSTKAKKFAALAPPYNKATAADRIAGAKKSKSSKKK